MREAWEWERPGNGGGLGMGEPWEWESPGNGGGLGMGNEGGMGMRSGNEAITQHSNKHCSNACWGEPERAPH